MKEKYTTQEIRMLPIAELQMGGYQRATNQSQVDKIATAFDEAKLGLPIVSLRDGQLHLLDGAHRIAAMRRLNYTHVMCIVLTGLTYLDEAMFFQTQNKNSRTLTQYNLFQAGLEARDTLCVAINRICQANGFRIGTSTRDFNTLSEIYALKVICAVYGYEILDATLYLIRRTWPGINNVTRREFLAGVAEFVHRFGTVKFIERMQFQNIDAIWRNYLSETSHSSRRTCDPAMRTAFCRALARFYNKGLSSKSKDRLVMED